MSIFVLLDEGSDLGAPSTEEARPQHLDVATWVLPEKEEKARAGRRPEGRGAQQHDRYAVSFRKHCGHLGLLDVDPCDDDRGPVGAETGERLLDPVWFSAVLARGELGARAGKAKPE